MAPRAEEIVAERLVRFAQSRRELAEGLARRHGVRMGDSVKRFFDAVESGRWDEIEVAFQRINGGDSSASHTDQRDPDVAKLWPAIIDAYGVAEQVHLWPAQQLLDYGRRTLESLRPGMVYVGGTDSGRWIPEFLNETNPGERHVVITQNGLAGSDYLDYLRLQYSDRLQLPSDDETKQIFDDYVTDAGRRLKHDQEHPDEPSQLMPGEEITLTDGKVSVGGQTAVMGINEKILKSILDQNADRAFALQESIPLKGLYQEAVPLGPLMELRGRTESAPMDPQIAAESIAYWRGMAQQVGRDLEVVPSPEAARSYSHDIVSGANLLAGHQFGAEAEEGYRLASTLWPENPEATAGLVDLLARTGRTAEALKQLDGYIAQNPEHRAELEKVSVTYRKYRIAPKP